jgi:TP901-1 family phage major tail protein
MAAFVGRTVVLEVAGAAVAGARTKSFTIGNEPVDITSDDDSGFRTMLSVAGTKTLDMSVEGVTKDGALIALASGSSGLIEDVEITFPGIGTIAGDFFVASVELGAAYNEASTFSASLQSSGAYTYTPAA